MSRLTGHRIKADVFVTGCVKHPAVKWNCRVTQGDVGFENEGGKKADDPLILN